MAFSNGYTYRRTLTVDNTKVNGSGDLTNFPVLVKGTYSYLATVANAGKVEHASGYDIRFESTGDVKLDHEVVYWSATTGEVVIWVEVPTLDGDADTSFYMYYGNSSVSSAEENPTGVWDTNYKGVWHMSQDPSGSAPQLLDSTSNNYDMTTAGTMTSGDLITGQIYKAIDFDGTDDEAKNTAWASVIDENDAFTIEHWFNIASTPNAQMVAWGEAGASNLCSTGTYGNNIGFLGYANDHLVSAAPYDDGNWHHLVVTHNGSTVKVIINGTEVLSEGMTMGTNAGQDLYFARWKDGGFYPAKLEEIRISTGARSNEWAITTYETSKNPSTFYSVGTETTSGGTAYDVVAAVGAFTLTGQSAGLSHGTKVASDAGSFALTGQDAGLSFGTGITNNAGAFALTGNSANLSHATIMALEAGALTLTGNDVSFTSGYVLGCAPGSYALTGNDATFNLGLTMTADTGTFALTGNDTGLSYGVTLNSETGTFVLTGQDAGLSTQYVVLTETGGFLLTGQDAALTFSQIMSAETGAYTITGNDNALPIAYKINPETGTFTLTGNNAGLNLSSPSGAGNIIIGIAI